MTQRMVAALKSKRREGRVPRRERRAAKMRPATKNRNEETKYKIECEILPHLISFQKLIKDKEYPRIDAGCRSTDQ